MKRYVFDTLSGAGMFKLSPTHHTYLVSDHSTVRKVNEIFSGKIKKSSLDLNWIDELIKEYPKEEFSTNFDHEDFPLYHYWPQEWRQAYEDAENEIYVKNRELTDNAELEIKRDQLMLWIVGDEVYLKTPHYNDGSIEKMRAIEHFITAKDAAIEFLNELKKFHKYGKLS